MNSSVAPAVNDYVSEHSYSHQGQRLCYMPRVGSHYSLLELTLSEKCIEVSLLSTTT